jgi:hypothetical protein
MHEFHKSDVEWKKPNTKEYILHGSIYIKFETRCDWREHEGVFQNASHVLFHDLGTGFTGVLTLCKYT